MLFREPAEVQNQLPYLFISKKPVSLHPGSRRAVADDPEQLAVRNLPHGLGAGEISRHRRQTLRHDSEAVPLRAMTDFARRRFGEQIEQRLPSFQVFPRWLQRVLHLVILFGSVRGVSGLRTDAGTFSPFEMMLVMRLAKVPRQQQCFFIKGMGFHTPRHARTQRETGEEKNLRQQINKISAPCFGPVYIHH